MKQIIFYDTEFTTWEGAAANGWSLPGQYRELVQIAAGRYDLETLTMIDEFEILMKPVRNPVLSDYFTSLTGVTNEEVAARGLSFADALAEFRNFVGDLLPASYGGDARIVRENLGFNDMEGTFEDFNIAPWFYEHGAPYGIVKGVNSGRLAKTLNIPIDEIQEHNALHDVRSIAAAYKFLIGKNAPSPFAIKKAA